MKTTPLVLLSLGVLSSAGPVPEGIHPVREVAAVDTHGLAGRPDSDNSANSRRKGRALDARNRRTRRRQRQFRRDDDWTDDDDTTDDEQPAAPVPAPAPAPAPAPTSGQPQEEQHWTDDDGHYTSCDEFPNNEQCSRPPRARTTQIPTPVATTRVNTSQPTTKPLGHGDDTDNPDWETDCDSDWTDDGEHERCKTKTKIAPTATATTMRKIPSSTGVHVTTSVPATTARPQDDDTDNPDYLTDCDSDWTDDGEHERCKTRTKTLGATPTKAVTRVQPPGTTVSAAASLPTEDTDTDNPDYLTDCDSDWTDDGERERCRTRVVSVTPTATGSPTAPDNEPVEITNGAAVHPRGVKHAVAMAGLAAAVAFVL